MDSETVKPIDVSSEIASAANVAFDQVMFTAEFIADFKEAFGRRADATNMARPVRLEDVDHFARAAAGVLLADPSFRESVISLLGAGIRESMSPK